MKIRDIVERCNSPFDRMSTAPCQWELLVVNTVAEHGRHEELVTRD